MKSTDNPRIVIVGYGNPLRGDDGVGFLAAEELAAAQEDPRIWVCASHVLLPELADPLSKCELAILIDAATNLPAGAIRCEEIVPPAFVTQPMMHHMTPQSLLACARRFFKRCPKALLYTIGGSSFAHSEGLTREVAAARRRVITRIRALCDELLPDILWKKRAGARRYA